MYAIRSYYVESEQILIGPKIKGEPDDQKREVDNIEIQRTPTAEVRDDVDDAHQRDEAADDAAVVDAVGDTGSHRRARRCRPSFNRLGQPMP